jgi:hypothetical protein
MGLARHRGEAHIGADAAKLLTEKRAAKSLRLTALQTNNE